MPKLPESMQMQTYVQRKLLINGLLPIRDGGGYPLQKLLKGTTMYQECRHIKTSGKKCGAAALRGKPYCYFHARYRSRYGRNSGAKSLSTSSPLSPIPALDLPLLEDRSAVQLALTDVVQALASGELDPRRAGLLLYALQIASANAVRDYDIVASETVRTVSQNKNGEELGPAVTGYDSEDYEDEEEEDEEDEGEGEDDDPVY